MNPANPMRYTSLLIALMLAGCSTHPVANVQDFFRPGKMYANEVDPYGGVCIQQGPVLAPGLPPIVVPGTTPGIVPPPVPLPGTAPGPVPPPPSFPLPTPG